MNLYIHVPMFGSPNIESKAIECPVCPRGKSFGTNNWVSKNIDICEPGQTFTCAECGFIVTINWGLVEPDHLSSWLNSEYCPHRMCQIKYQELKKEKYASRIQNT